jgi:DNA-binding SARP family transcriptional activator
MPRLNVLLFNHLEVTSDFGSVRVGGHRAADMLAYLVLYNAAPHPREVLAGVLWPEAPHIHARAYVRRALHSLRRSLGVAGGAYWYATASSSALTGSPFGQTFGSLRAHGRRWATSRRTNWVGT